MVEEVKAREDLCWGRVAEGSKGREGRSVARAGVLDGVAHRGQRPAGFAPPVEHRTPDRVALLGPLIAVVVQAGAPRVAPSFMALAVGPARVLIAAKRPLTLA